MLDDRRREGVPKRHARLFRNGRNQALRIPRDFELAADEVIIYRDDNCLVVEPVERTPSLSQVLAQLKPLEERFPPMDDPPSDPEDLL